MAGRNRMNYGRDQSSAHYQGYAYGSPASQQLGNPRDAGLGGRDNSRGRREDQEPQLSRRLSGPPYAVVDPRVLSARVGQGLVGDGRVVSGGRGGLLPAAEPPITQQILNSGVNRLAYEQGGLVGPGGVASHLHSVPMRGVGPVDSYGGVDSYGLLQQQQQQVQLADGSLRAMYSIPDMGGSLPGEFGERVVGGFRGGYMGSEEEKLALQAAQAQKLQQSQGYHGRQILRDGRVVSVGGWEEDVPVVPPLSPRAMPMSPRRDDLVRMMSPRREDLTPPPMSPRRDDLSHMMSPRREDISPVRSPRRREYPTGLDYGGRLQQRRGFSPSREEDYLVQRQDFPMSPRRGAPITPPMSPRGGWDYEGPPVSPPRMAVPMSPRHDTPTRSPVWGRPKHGARVPSQWDILPGKGGGWNSASERETRRDGRHVLDHPRGSERTLGYGADIEDPKRLGPGWTVSRRGDGRYGRGSERDALYGPPAVGGRSYGEQQPTRYGMANSRPYAYSSVVNQRVGLVTKYIERERAERAAERAAKDPTEKTYKEPSRRKPASDERAPTDKSKPSHADRRNEKDTLAAAIAKSTAAMNAKHSSSSGKKSKHDKSSAAASGKLVPPSGTSNSDRTGGGNKKSGVNLSSATAAGTSTANGIAAGGPSGPPSSTKGAKDNKNAEAGKAATEEAAKTNVADVGGTNNGRHNNGPRSKPANGKSNSGSKPGADQQREASSKRPSLVMEIERAKKSRKLAEQERNAQIREVEETYYDANELSADFVSKVNKAGSRYSRMLNDDPYLRRRYQGGGQAGLHCLVCGKGSKTFSDVQELVTHAQHSQLQSKRIDHMGFRKALIDVLKLDITDPPVSNIETEEDMIVWPPVVVVENTRTGLGADKRWEGVTNSEMALLLNELGHLHGRPKSIWDKFGHRGIVHVEFDPSLEGLQEAERLHNYFMQNGRGRVQWDIIRPFKTGLPGFENVPEGPDFTRFDEVTKTNKRVLYGYVALKKDIEKIFSKKGRKKAEVKNRKELKAKLLARQAGEQIVI